MTNSSEDEEIARIQKKKITEMLQRAQTQTKPTDTANNKPITLSDANFSSEIAKHKLILVDFWASWCSPCRMVGPLIEQLGSRIRWKSHLRKDKRRRQPDNSKQLRSPRHTHTNSIQKRQTSRNPRRSLPKISNRIKIQTAHGKKRATITQSKYSGA